MDFKGIFDAFVAALIKGAKRPEPVTVREAGFGYVVRSYKRGSHADIMEQVFRFVLVAFWVGAVAIWLVPNDGASAMTMAMASGMLVLGGYGALTLTRLPIAKTELHVDTSRREIRSATVSGKGQSWIRASARFGEIAEPILRHNKADTAKTALSLRIVGSEEELPVAIGEEAVLLAIHDRIMRDMRPVEESLAAYNVKTRPTRLVPRPAFPQLGPVELGR